MDALCEELGAICLQNKSAKTNLGQHNHRLVLYTLTLPIGWSKSLQTTAWHKNVWRLILGDFTKRTYTEDDHGISRNLFWRGVLTHEHVALKPNLIAVSLLQVYLGFQQLR